MRASRTKTRPGTLIAPFVLAVLAAGCTPDYNPSNYIEKYRVLGVVVDPPAVQFTPNYQGEVTLTLVDALPLRAVESEGEVDPVINGIDWSVCLISAGAAARYACAMDEIPLTDVSADGRTAVFDGALVAFGIDMLGTQFDAVIEGLRQAVKYSDQCTRDMLAQYEACLADKTTDECNPPAFEAFKGCLYEGGLQPVFHVAVSVTDMLLDDADDPVMDDDGRAVTRDRTIDVYKSVSFGNWTEENPANRNPEFSIRRAGRDFDVYDDIRHPENLVVTTAGDHEQPEIKACPGQSLQFLATVPPSSIDQVTGEDGVPVNEYYLLSWYTNNGRFGKVRTGSVTAEGLDIDLSNILTFDRDEQVRTTTVHVVMRDEAFGLSHLQFKIKGASRWECRGLHTLTTDEGGVE